jgi:hypothetical protein
VSADWWVKIHRPTCAVDAGDLTKFASTGCACPIDGSLNVTYNLTPMLREAGMFPGSHRDLIGAPCSETAGVAESARARLLADPDRFKALNPPNGWGDYDGAVEFVTDLRDMCARWSWAPTARLEGSL